MDLKELGELFILVSTSDQLDTNPNQWMHFCTAVMARPYLLRYFDPNALSTIGHCWIGRGTVTVQTVTNKFNRWLNQN